MAYPISKIPVVLFPLKLETRFVKNELWIRAFPDEAFLQSHDPRLTRQERLDVEAFKQKKSSEGKKAAWGELVSKYGVYRSAWLVQISSKELKEPKSDVDSKAEKEENEEPTFYFKWLPDRLVAYLYKDNETDPIIGKGAKIDRKGLTVFGDGDDWIEDFDTAVNVGMGIKIKLDNPADSSRFEKVIVTGIRLTEDEDPVKLAEGLAELFHNHQYTEGFSFLEYGAPTNNTEKAKSGYSARDEYNAGDSFNYAVEGLDLEVKTDDASFPSYPAGSYFAHDLGFDIQDLKHVKQADLVKPKLNSLYQKASWFALGAEPIFMLFGDQISSDTHEHIWHHYSKYVRVKGLHTSVKIGKQPYGILPVMSIRKILQEEATMNTGSVFNKISFVLARLFERWASMVKNDIENIPQLGDSDDSYAEILEILSMQESSGSYHIRGMGYKHFRGRLQKWLQEMPSDQPLDSLLEKLPDLLNEDYEEVKKKIDSLAELFEGIPIDKEKLLYAAIMSFIDGNAQILSFKEDEAKILDQVGKGQETAAPFSLVEEDLSSLEKFIEQLQEVNDDSLIQYTNDLSLFTDLFLRGYTNASQLYFREICFEPTLEQLRGNQLFTIDKLSKEAGSEITKGALALEIIGRRHKKSKKSQKIAIKAPFDGRIEEIFVLSGQEVKVGMPLFRLKNEEKRNEVKEQFIYLGKQIIPECKAISDPEKRKRAQMNALSEAIDLNSYRLDAWLTSLASKHLEDLRSQPKYEKGIYFGAYGWVEDLIKDTDSAVSEKMTDIYRENGGMIHAPNPAQSVASAIFKNSFLANTVSYALTDESMENLKNENLPKTIIAQLEEIKDQEFESEEEFVEKLKSIIRPKRDQKYLPLILQHSEESNPFILNLTSDRIQKSHFLLDGIRQGQEIEALIGYRFERTLHDRELDVVISPLRKAFPLDADRELINGSASAIENLSVIDGLKAVKNKENLSDFLSRNLSKEEFSGINAHIDSIKDCIDKLDDLLDGSLDTLFYEAGYQITQGNLSLAAAALEATKGALEPPTTEALKTRISGVGLGHKLSMIFPEPVSPNIENYKGFVEPVLETWLKDNIGDFSKIGCKVELYNPEDNSLIDTHEVKLSDLGIGYLDFLYMSDDPVSDGASELEMLIWKFVSGQISTSADSASYKITKAAPPGCQPLSKALEVARYTLAFLSKCRWLKSDDITLDDEPINYSWDALDSIKDGRLSPVLNKLKSLKIADLKKEDILSDLTRLDIEQAKAFLIEGVNIDTEKLKKEIDQKVTLAMQHLAKYNHELPFYSAFEHLNQAARILFGKPFILLPPTIASEKFSQVIKSKKQHLLIGDKASNNSGKVWGQERINNWVQGVSQVRDNTEAFEDWQMVNKVWAESLSIKQENAYQIVQGPTLLQYPWVGLSKQEIRNLIDENYQPKDVYKSPETGTPYPLGEDHFYPDGCESTVIYSAKEFSFERAGKKVPIFGMVIDEFPEHIPDKKINTGLSFHYNAPNSEPPQALLLALHPKLGEEGSYFWEEEDLRDIIYDTMDLYKIRMADLEVMKNLNPLLPFTYWFNIPKAG